MLCDRARAPEEVPGEATGEGAASATVEKPSILQIPGPGMAQESGCCGVGNWPEPMR